MGLRLSLPLALMLAAAHIVADAACVAESDGIRVAVSARATTSSPVFPTNRGYTVTLRRAHVCVSTVALSRCDLAARRLGTRLARAHGDGTPTRLAVPGVVSLVGDGSAVKLGELAPPAGRYCDVRVALAPADADAVGLPTDGAATGLTVLIEGVARRGSEPPIELHVAAAAHANVTTSTELILDTPGRTALVIELATDRLFDDIEFAVDGRDSVEQKVVNALSRGIGAKAQ